MFVYTCSTGFEIKWCKIGWKIFSGAISNRFLSISDFLLFGRTSCTMSTRPNFHWFEIDPNHNDHWELSQTVWYHPHSRPWYPLLRSTNIFCISKLFVVYMMCECMPKHPKNAENVLKFSSKLFHSKRILRHYCKFESGIWYFNAMVD